KHGGFAPIRKREQIRSQGIRVRSLCLDTHASGTRTHDNVVAAHGGRIDRLWLRASRVLRSIKRDPRNASRTVAERAEIFGACGGFMRGFGSRYFTLAVLIDGPLPVGGAVCADCRSDERGHAVSSHCRRPSPHGYRPLRVRCGVTAPRLARRGAERRPIKISE